MNFDCLIIMQAMLVTLKQKNNAASEDSIIIAVTVCQYLFHRTRILTKLSIFEKTMIETDT